MKIVYRPTEKEERGSYTLGMAFSTVGGLLALLLFFNLIRYVAASNAVGQGARKAMRCVSPTDGGCISTVRYQGEPDVWRWFGQDIDLATRRRADRHTYTASMNRETWQLSYDYFNVHHVIPQLTVPQYEVPQYEYQPKLNEFERVYTSVLVSGKEETGQQFRAAFDDFAAFNIVYEDSLLNSADTAWSLLLPAGVSVGPTEIAVKMDKTGEKDVKKIPNTDLERLAKIGVLKEMSKKRINFNTEPFIIPVLEATEADAIRVRRNGDLWGDSFTVNHGGTDSVVGKNHWSTHARLAIKVFLIADSTENGQIRFDKRDALLVTVEGDPSYDRKLGGRDWSAPIGAPTWYHLRLRGPKGAHGAAAVKGEGIKTRAGLTYHDDIVVPRGKKIRIKMVARTRNGPVDAAVYVRVWYEKYNGPTPLLSEEVPPVTCNDIPLKVGESPKSERVCNLCYVELDKVYPNHTQERGCDTVGALKRAPTCETGDSEFLHPVSGDSFASAPTYATCTGETPPPTWEKPEPPAGREYCSDEVNAVLKDPAVVNQLPPGCGGVSSIAGRSLACNDSIFSPDRSYGDKLTTCPNLPEELKEINNHNQKLFGELNMASAFSPLTPEDLSWGEPAEYAPARWEFSWSAPGGKDASHPEVAKKLTAQFKNQGEIYTRADDGWKPKLCISGTLDAEDESICNGYAFPVGRPEGYNAPSLASVISRLPEIARVELVNSEKVAIDDVWPFIDEKTYKIPHFQDNREGCETSYPDEEAQFRDYASSTNKIAEKWVTDRSLKFDFEGPYVDSDIYLSAACGHPAVDPLEGVPNCAITTASAEEECSREDLGIVFGDDTPAACENFDRCFRQLVQLGKVEVMGGLPITVNTPLIEAKALEEIRRTYPSAQMVAPEECTQGVAGCSFVLLNIEDNGIADMVVGYNLGITFPFNLMIGRDTVTVWENKREAVESLVYGRKITF